MREFYQQKWLGGLIHASDQQLSIILNFTSVSVYRSNEGDCDNDMWNAERPAPSKNFSTNLLLSFKLTRSQPTRLSHHEVCKPRRVNRLLCHSGPQIIATDDARRTVSLSTRQHVQHCYRPSNQDEDAWPPIYVHTQAYQQHVCLSKSSRSPISEFVTYRDNLHVLLQRWIHQLSTVKPEFQTKNKFRLGV